MAVDIREQLGDVSSTDYEGQPPTRVADSRLVPSGYQQLALSLSGPTYLTVPVGASIALINCEAQPLRYLDSDAVSPVYGLLLPAGSSIYVTLADLRTISLCASAAGAIANVLYYRVPAGREKIKAEVALIAPPSGPVPSTNDANGGGTP